MAPQFLAKIQHKTELFEQNENCSLFVSTQNLATARALAIFGRYLYIFASRSLVYQTFEKPNYLYSFGLRSFMYQIFQN